MTILIAAINLLSMNITKLTIEFQHPTSATIPTLEADWLQGRINLLLQQRYELVGDGAGAILQARFNSQLVTEGVQLTSEVR